MTEEPFIKKVIKEIFCANYRFREIKSLKCCVEIFIRGNVWGAPLSGPGNGPCNSDGGENARKSRKRFHWNQEIASKLHRLPNYSRKSIPGIRRWNQRFINLQNCLQEISWVTDARKKNIFLQHVSPPPPSQGATSNVIIQMWAIIWISTILAHYTQINMFIQLDGILAYLESQHQKANNMIAEPNISHKIPNLIF